MAAKKLEELGYRIILIAGIKYIRISDILKNTDWDRTSIYRRMTDGTLKYYKWDTKVYINWDSFLAWQGTKAHG